MNAPHILIVEDDLAISEHLGAIAMRVLDAEPAVATSVAEAEVLFGEKPDLALLDIDVRDGTTYAFAMGLSENEIPFAFVSASDRGKLPEPLRSAPFVEKPFEEQQIVSVLNHLHKDSGRQTR